MEITAEMASSAVNYWDERISQAIHEHRLSTPADPLEGLSPKQKRAIKLYQEGYRSTQAAAIAGVNPATLRRIAAERGIKVGNRNALSTSYQYNQFDILRAIELRCKTACTWQHAADQFGIKVHLVMQRAKCRRWLAKYAPHLLPKT